MSDNDKYENYKKLTANQKKFVKAYTNEGDARTFLNPYESYVAVGLGKGGSVRTHRTSASRLVCQPRIQAAIKELAPKCFDSYFLRDRWMKLLEDAEKEGNVEQRRKVLVDMSRVEGLFDKDSSKESEKTDAAVSQAVAVGQELWRKRLEEMRMNTEVKPIKKVK